MLSLWVCLAIGSVYAVLAGPGEHPSPSAVQVARIPVARQQPRRLPAPKASSGPLVPASGKWRVRVSLAKQRLYLLDGSKSRLELVVSTGLYRSTPSGRFRIVENVADPPYYGHGVTIPPGRPENPMGSAWLGLDYKNPASGFPIGIHGTNQPSQLGRVASSGCIRVANDSVLILHKLLPVGTEVNIE